MAEPLEVEPCPLCGAQPNVGQVMAAGLIWWDVECPACGLRLSNTTSAEAAREAWNTRTPDQMAGVDGEVTQADREMAVAIRHALYRAQPDMPSYPGGIIYPLLAEHRRAAVAVERERCARTAETPIGDPANPSWHPRSASEIAAAIRQETRP